MRRKKLYRLRLPQPAHAMNMTPLIDVLLVLIVMMIITVPLATHSLEVPLPSGRAELAILDRNTVGIRSDDTLLWNGQALDRRSLGYQLVATAEQGAASSVRFEPDANASYDRSAKTIALIKDAGIERFAFVGNERYRNFDAP